MDENKINDLTDSINKLNAYYKQLQEKINNQSKAASDSFQNLNSKINNLNQNTSRTISEIDKLTALENRILKLTKLLKVTKNKKIRENIKKEIKTLKNQYKKLGGSYKKAYENHHKTLGRKTTEGINNIINSISGYFIRIKDDIKNIFTTTFNAASSAIGAAFSFGEALNLGIKGYKEVSELNRGYIEMQGILNGLNNSAQSFPFNAMGQYTSTYLSFVDQFNIDLGEFNSLMKEAASLGGIKVISFSQVKDAAKLLITLEKVHGLQRSTAFELMKKGVQDFNMSVQQFDNFLMKSLKQNKGLGLTAEETVSAITQIRSENEYFGLTLEEISSILAVTTKNFKISKNSAIEMAKTLASTGKKINVAGKVLMGAQAAKFKIPGFENLSGPLDAFYQIQKKLMEPGGHIDAIKILMKTVDELTIGGDTATRYTKAFMLLQQEFLGAMDPEQARLLALKIAEAGEGGGEKIANEIARQYESLKKAATSEFDIRKRGLELLKSSNNQFEILEKHLSIAASNLGSKAVNLAAISYNLSLMFIDFWTNVLNYIIKSFNKINEDQLYKIIDNALAFAEKVIYGVIDFLFISIPIIIKILKKVKDKLQDPEFKKAVFDFIKNIKEKIIFFIDFIKTIIQTPPKDLMKNILKNLFEGIKIVLSNIFSKIIYILTGIKIDPNIFTSIIQGITNVISILFLIIKNIPIINSLLIQFFKGITDRTSEVFSEITSPLNSKIADINNLFTTIEKELKDVGIPIPTFSLDSNFSLNQIDSILEKQKKIISNDMNITTDISESENQFKNLHNNVIEISKQISNVNIPPEVEKIFNNTQKTTTLNSSQKNINNNVNQNTSISKQIYNQTNKIKNTYTLKELTTLQQPSPQEIEMWNRAYSSKNLLNIQNPSIQTSGNILQQNQTQNLSQQSLTPVLNNNINTINNLNKFQKNETKITPISINNINQQMNTSKTFIDNSLSTVIDMLNTTIENFNKNTTTNLTLLTEMINKSVTQLEEGKKLFDKIKISINNFLETIYKVNVTFIKLWETEIKTAETNFPLVYTLLFQGINQISDTLRNIINTFVKKVEEIVNQLQNYNQETTENFEYSTSTSQQQSTQQQSTQQQSTQQQPSSQNQNKTKNLDETIKYILDKFKSSTKSPTESSPLSANDIFALADSLRQINDDTKDNTKNKIAIEALDKLIQAISPEGENPYEQSNLEKIIKKLLIPPGEFKDFFEKKQKGNLKNLFLEKLLEVLKSKKQSTQSKQPKQSTQSKQSIQPESQFMQSKQNFQTNIPSVNNDILTTLLKTFNKEKISVNDIKFFIRIKESDTGVFPV